MSSRIGIGVNLIGRPRPDTIRPCLGQGLLAEPAQPNNLMGVPGRTLSGYASPIA